MKRNYNSREYYVYILLNPDKKGKYTYGSYEFNYEPYYVGMGSRVDRVLDHYKKHNRKQYKKSWLKHRVISEIKNTDNDYLYEIVKSSLSIKEAWSLEIELVNTIGRIIYNSGPLTNLTNGGDGGVGCTWSEESKRKKSESMMGQNNHFYGKTHTEETMTIIKKWLLDNNEEFRRKLSGVKKTFKDGVNPKKGGHRDDLSNESIQSIKDKLSNPVIQKTKDGQTIKEWSSMKEASNTLNISYSAISGCVNGRSKTSGGFIWEKL
jgi:group I intron endonuclease